MTASLTWDFSVDTDAVDQRAYKIALFVKPIQGIIVRKQVASPIRNRALLGNPAPLVANRVVKLRILCPWHGWVLGSESEDLVVDDHLYGNPGDTEVHKLRAYKRHLGR